MHSEVQFDICPGVDVVHKLPDTVLWRRYYFLTFKRFFSSVCDACACFPSLARQVLNVWVRGHDCPDNYSPLLCRAPGLADVESYSHYIMWSAQRKTNGKQVTCEVDHAMSICNTRNIKKYIFTLLYFYSKLSLQLRSFYSSYCNTSPCCGQGRSGFPYDKNSVVNAWMP